MLMFGILLTIAALFLLACYICYRIAYYEPPRKERPADFIDLPPGKAYEPFYDKMTYWVRQLRKLPQEHFEITSFDGLKLHGTFYGS